MAILLFDWPHRLKGSAKRHEAYFSRPVKYMYV